MISNRGESGQNFKSSERNWRKASAIQNILRPVFCIEKKKKKDISASYSLCVSSLSGSGLPSKAI